MTIDSLVREIFTFFTNNLNLEKESHINTFYKLIILFEQFGETGVEALLRYKNTATSNFFDYPFLIKCLKAELAKAEGLLQAEKAWGQVVKILPNYNSHRDLIERDKTYVNNPQLAETIESLGGWTYLASLDNNQLGFERKQFLANYEKALDSRLTNIIIEVESKIKEVDIVQRRSRKSSN